MVWALILLVLLLALLARRLFVGGPRRDSSCEHLSNAEAALLEAAADTLLPAVPGGLARPGADADIAAIADRHLAALPVRQRRQIRLMCVAFEHATLVFPASGRGGFARFTSLSPAQRLEYLQGFATSRFALRRTLLTALRAYVVMAVLGHPDNLRGLDLDPWSIEPPTIETDLLYPEVGAPRSSIELTEADLTAVRDVRPLAGGGGGGGGGVGPGSGDSR